MIELLCGFILGWIAAIAVLNTLVKRALEMAERQKPSTPSKKIPTYYLREHHGQLYLWDDNDAFITQGATLEAILASLGSVVKTDRALLVTDTETLFVNNGAILMRGSRAVEHEQQQ